MSESELEERIKRFEDLCNHLYRELEGDSRLEQVYMVLNEAYTNRNWEKLIKGICLIQDIIRDRDLEVEATDYAEDIEFLFDWEPIKKALQ